MLDLDRLAAALVGAHGGTVTGDAGRREVSEMIEPRIRHVMERDGVTRTEAVLVMLREYRQTI